MLLPRELCQHLPCPCSCVCVCISMCLYTRVNVQTCLKREGEPHSVDNLSRYLASAAIENDWVLEEAWVRAGMQCCRVGAVCSEQDQSLRTFKSRLTHLLRTRPQGLWLPPSSALIRIWKVLGEEEDMCKPPGTLGGWGSPKIGHPGT